MVETEVSDDELEIPASEIAKEDAIPASETAEEDAIPAVTNAGLTSGLCVCNCEELLFNFFLFGLRGI